MICNVEYSVPVEVQVDTETGAVKRVVVLDELVEPAKDSNEVPIVEEQGAIPLCDDAIAARAIQIAEDKEWPAWEFGW